MDHRQRALQTLSRLTRLLAMGTQGSALLHTILREALGLTGARGGQVLLLRADRRALLTHIGAGDDIADADEMPADAPPWADVICEGKVVQLRAMRPAAHHGSADRPITLGMPLLARGDVLGVLALRDLSEVWAKPDRQPFVEALAHLAAHALVR